MQVLMQVQEELYEPDLAAEENATKSEMLMVHIPSGMKMVRSWKKVLSKTDSWRD